MEPTNYYVFEKLHYDYKIYGKQLTPSKGYLSEIQDTILETVYILELIVKCLFYYFVIELSGDSFHNDIPQITVHE